MTPGFANHLVRKLMIMTFTLTAAAIVGLSATAFIMQKPSKQRIDRRDSALREVGETLFFKGAKFTGVVLEKFPDGTSFRETEYVDGLKEGVALEYAFSGQLRARWHFSRGKKDGEQRGWYIEGPRRFVANFKNGLLDGEQIEWHLNGSLFRQMSFIEGVEVAKKILFPTEEVYSNYRKVDGRIFGLDSGPLCFEKKPEGEK